MKLTPDQAAKVSSILTANVLGVVSTNSATGFPQAAVVAVSETDTLEIIFATFNDTRKFFNLLTDPRVAVVMGWNNDDKRTLQMEGRARLVEGPEVESIASIHCTKSAGSRRFRDDPRQRYFVVTLSWLRYSDFGVNSSEIWEVSNPEM